MRGDLLGRGMYGVVRKATERKSGRTFAIKSIATSRLRPREVLQLREEIKLMGSLDHPNVVKIFEAFEVQSADGTAVSLFLVLELCTGGALVDHVGAMTEREAARVIRKLLLALRHCHALGIAHRDVKPANFVMSNLKSDAEPKLVDFGLARALTESASMQTFCGTLPFVAPECFAFRGDKRGAHRDDDGYGLSCDVWSAGVFAHVLLSGQLPFKDAMHAAAEGRGPAFAGARWKLVSQEAKEFVRAMMRVDPGTRPTSREALELPWIARSQQRQDAAGLDGDRGVAAGEVAALDRAKAFRDMSVVKRAALAFVAHRIHSPRNRRIATALEAAESTETEDSLSMLRRVFQRIDTHCTGVVSRAELEHAFVECGIAGGPGPASQASLFEAIDFDDSGGISYGQFLAATLEAAAVDDATWSEAFDAIDVDGSGSVTAANLKRCLGEWGDDELAAAIAEADLSGDGAISRAEFLAVCKSSERLDDVREEYLQRQLASSGTA